MFECPFVGALNVKEVLISAFNKRRPSPLRIFADSSQHNQI